MRHSAPAPLRCLGITLALLALAGAGLMVAQRLKPPPTPPNVQHGQQVYNSGCIVCHGPTGKGAAQTNTEFTRPATFPDFSRCDQTTPETDAQYKRVITHGGPEVGFSTIMPSFGHLLSDSDINDVVAYLRTFCTEKNWPRGELNLPRALVTEKAFPENELVLTSEANATGAPSWTVHAIHEQTISKRDQIEVDLPWDLQDQNHAYANHIGDMTFGLKHVFYSNLKNGTIFALQGGVIPPTGSEKLGGNGTTVFEPFAALDKLFVTNTWIQFQMGADLPFDSSKTPKSMFWYTALGQTLAKDHRMGRQWSPTVEFLADRDLVDGAKADWDVLPEMQVSLSKRQHIRANVGVRVPFTDTAGRTPQVNFYVLWDWADGHFWEGW